jgi:hypothetical protein
MTSGNRSFSYLPLGALTLALLVSGCGEGSNSAAFPTPSDSVSADAELNVATIDVSLLESSEQSIVSENAKQMKKAYEKNDYTRAAYALGNMASVPLTSEEQGAIRSALEGLKTAATKAAGEGNENAKRAVAFLDETFGQ